MSLPRTPRKRGGPDPGPEPVTQQQVARGNNLLGYKYPSSDLIRYTYTLLYMYIVYTQILINVHLFLLTMCVVRWVFGSALFHILAYVLYVDISIGISISIRNALMYVCLIPQQPSRQTLENFCWAFFCQLLFSFSRRKKFKERLVPNRETDAIERSTGLDIPSSFKRYAQHSQQDMFMIKTIVESSLTIFVKRFRYKAF